MATCAPSFAKAIAVARPIPLAAPVMSTVFPFSPVCMLRSLLLENIKHFFVAINAGGTLLTSLSGNTVGGAPSGVTTRQRRVVLAGWFTHSHLWLFPDGLRPLRRSPEDIGAESGGCDDVERAVVIQVRREDVRACSGMIIDHV